jgi:predicted DsbA family dithiol-disulfide isomerase
MSEPVRLDVFSDYLCPWCYNAAVRLRDVEQAYGDQVRVHWRTFPLIPDRQPGRRATAKTQAARQRVGAEEPRALFVAPELDVPLPASSVPALTAAKSAERQGDSVFQRFHDALFVAHFRDNLDISRYDVLCDLAHACGLDLPHFRNDYASSEVYEAVLHDCAEGTGWFGVSALPTVIFNEKLSLVGAVPVERYRLMIDWLLAGEPGGVIPLGPTIPGPEAPGQSVVGSRDAAP